MIVMIVYVVMAAIGEVVAYGAGIVIERTVPDFAMVLYMALFFGVLFGVWPLAVRVTEKYLLRTA